MQKGVGCVWTQPTVPGQRPSIMLHKDDTDRQLASVSIKIRAHVVFQFDTPSYTSRLNTLLSYYNFLCCSIAFGQIKREAVSWSSRISVTWEHLKVIRLQVHTCHLCRVVISAQPAMLWYWLCNMLMQPFLAYHHVNLIFHNNNNNKQTESNALYSRSAGSHVFVSADFCGNSAV